MSVKLPPDVHFAPDFHLLLWKPRGILNEAGVNSILSFIGEQEALSSDNEIRFVDTTALTAVDLNFRYVFHVALHRRLSRAGQLKLKSAFLVKDQGFAHYFRMHAL